MAKREGPSVNIEMSCFDCAHEESTRYQCQGDSGRDVTCAHPEAGPNGGARYIGDTTWKTPEWCPLRGAALAALLAEVSRG